MGLQDVTTAAGEQQRRDTAIRQAFDAGVPIGAIASAANLTRARVASILGHPFQHVGRPPRTPPPGS
jgi:hypothetical protein